MTDRFSSHEDIEFDTEALNAGHEARMLSATTPVIIPYAYALGNKRRAYMAGWADADQTVLAAKEALESPDECIF